MKKYYALSCAAALFLSSCIAVNVEKSTVSKSQNYNPSLQDDGKLYASFYQQQAAEYEALSLQAFNIARLRLDEALSHNNGRPLAIVTDIDETFLDNSYYATYCAKRGLDYDEATWIEWTSKGIATPLKGALDFFKYANDKGVSIFYVTNRKEVERKGTTLNLRRYGFPIQDEQHLVFRTTESSKENRRKKIAEKYNIVLLLGDNLSDFSKDFDHLQPTERSQAVENNKSQFGKRFIILPNFSYGDWEAAVFNYKYNLPKSERDAIIQKLTKENPSH